MKLISLSSSIAGPACAIATSTKKYYYNNEKITDIFDYLEISLKSINQFLLLNENDILYLDFEDYILNHNGGITVKFKNFDKIYSHHDLHQNYDQIKDVEKLKEKYIRRYHRFINDLKNETHIIFIRYGTDDNFQIQLFKENIKKINPNLKFNLIIINSVNNQEDLDNIYINIELDTTKDLFYEIINYDWNKIFDKIRLKSDFFR